MADSSNDSLDTEILVKKTLQSLGKRLRLQFFIRKGLRNKKNEIEKQDAIAQAEIGRLKMRVQRELDAHPNIIRRFTELDDIEE